MFISFFGIAKFSAVEKFTEINIRIDNDFLNGIYVKTNNSFNEKINVTSGG